MVSKRSWKAWVVLGVAVAVFVTSGGLLMASNMGFKINKQIATNGTTGSRVTWISVPYNNPYLKVRGLCKAFVDTHGWSSALVASISIDKIQVGNITPPNGNTVSQSCITCCPTLASNCGILTGQCDLNLVHNNAADGAGSAGTNGGPAAVRITTTPTATIPVNVVLVGSSQETQNTPKLIPNAVDGGLISVTGSNRSHNWISVPYHTTWLKANDVCVSLGTTTLATAVNIARVTLAGGTLTFNCGTTLPNASNFDIVIGEGLRVRDTAAPTTNLPSAAPGGILVPHF
jgi:hypothetical protein